MGDAAFMRTPDDGRALARAMVSVGKKLGVNTRALLTEMDCPIGSTIGNALEVFESVECLNGEGPSDLSELVALEGGHLLHQVGLVQTPEEGFRRIDASLKDGSARDSFKQMLVAVGVDDAVVEDLFKVCIAQIYEAVSSIRFHLLLLLTVSSAFVLSIKQHVKTRKENENKI